MQHFFLIKSAIEEHAKIKVKTKREVRNISIIGEHRAKVREATTGVIPPNVIQNIKALNPKLAQENAWVTSSLQRLYNPRFSQGSIQHKHIH